MSELKPCPFCGGKPFCSEQVHLNPKVGEYWIVGCGNDDCPVDTCFVDQPSEAKAISAWNRRAAPVVTDDTRLMDFLADPSQDIANVQLPRHIVERNVHSLRDAIADTMAEWKASQPDKRSN